MLKRLRRENAELEARQRDPAYGVGFLRGRARPAVPVIVEFIHANADRRDGGLRWGVEPICTVLTDELIVQIAASTYYEWLGRQPSAGIVATSSSRPRSCGCTGRISRATVPARWLELNRQGVPVARCTVERLMAELGLAGVVRGKTKRTTIAELPRPSGPLAWCNATSPPRRWTGCGWPTSNADVGSSFVSRGPISRWTRMIATLPATTTVSGWCPTRRKSPRNKPWPPLAAGLPPPGRSGTGRCCSCAHRSPVKPSRSPTPCTTRSPPPSETRKTTSPTRPRRTGPPPTRLPLSQVRPGQQVLDTETKLITHAIRIAAYNTQAALARAIRIAAGYSRAAHEAHALITAALNRSGDIDPRPGVIHVRLDPLGTPRATAAIAQLCHALNETRTVFPGTNQQLHYLVKPHE